MVSNYERRLSERNNCDGLIRFALFNRTEYRQALITDCSQEGLRLQSQIELRPGCYLSIWVEIVRLAESEEICDVNVRSIGIAEVKWCQPITADLETVFAIGVKYLVPGYSE